MGCGPSSSLRSNTSSTSTGLLPSVAGHRSSETATSCTRSALFSFLLSTSSTTLSSFSLLLSTSSTTLTSFASSAYLTVTSSIGLGLPFLLTLSPLPSSSMVVPSLSSLLALPSDLAFSTFLPSTTSSMLFLSVSCLG
ncbi:hypothetical protein PoB_000182100 [Plakobranchus ocellatus]|uniref:REJ domain-containing protein n=1 Tax=Plakobranchus ocellatus TaxID=259542 RepID=A0AAV3XWW9_9GAST|nr:hypothetical protein PoB_000182100 [Plakobranchus ocellatus]